MGQRQIREISFTLRMDNSDHRAVVEWIDQKREGRQRFRQLREHIVRAMLDYIEDGEPKSSMRRTKNEEPSSEPRHLVTASASAAQAMDF